MSNTDPMNDAELVECAKEMRAVFYQGTHVKWESLVRVEAAAWLRIASFTRDFFRERWKPGRMPTPDFSGDPERVALAKVLLEANETFNRWNHMPLGDLVESTQRNYLAMADAVISRSGSGYRLPEATEANAARLATIRWRDLCEKPTGVTWNSLMELTRQSQCREALTYLRALRAAFADPAEKPEPVFAAAEPEDDLPFPEFAGATFEQCPATNGDHRCELPTGHGGEHSAEKLAWEEPSGNDSEAQINAKPAKDPVREGERRKERQELVRTLLGTADWATYSAAHVLKGAIEMTDAYLAWRDADNEKAMEAYRCK